MEWLKYYHKIECDVKIQMHASVRQIFVYIVYCVFLCEKQTKNYTIKQNRKTIISIICTNVKNDGRHATIDIKLNQFYLLQLDLFCVCACLWLWSQLLDRYKWLEFDIIYNHRCAFVVANNKLFKLCTDSINETLG